MVCHVTMRIFIISLQLAKNINIPSRDLEELLLNFFHGKVCILVIDKVLLVAASKHLYSTTPNSKL